MIFQYPTLPFVSESEYEMHRDGVQSIGHSMEQQVQCPGTLGGDSEVDPYSVDWVSTWSPRKDWGSTGMHEPGTPSLLNPGFLPKRSHLPRAYPVQK